MRTLILLIAFCFQLSAFSQGFWTPRIGGTNLVAWYLAGLGQSGLATNVNDLSGNSNTGTATNSPIWTNGPSGYKNAISFNGASQYVSTASSPLGSISVATIMTESLWVKLNTVPTGGRMDAELSPIQLADNFTFSFQINGSYWSAGPARVDVADQLITASNSVSAGTWHFLTLVLNNGNFSFYMDGVQQGITQAYNSTINGTSASPNNSWILGAALESGVLYHPINGSIADLRIFNRALTAAEIAAMGYWDGSTYKPR